MVPHPLHAVASSSIIFATVLFVTDSSLEWSTTDYNSCSNNISKAALVIIQHISQHKLKCRKIVNKAQVVVHDNKSIKKI